MGKPQPKSRVFCGKNGKSGLIYQFSIENSTFWLDFPQNLFSKNDRNIVWRGPTKISDKSKILDLKRSKRIFFCSRDLLIEDFWPIFAKISKFTEISRDLFFNYLVKIYLSQYRRNESQRSAALENILEKSVQLEVFQFLSIVWNSIIRKMTGMWTGPGNVREGSTCQSLLFARWSW